MADTILRVDAQAAGARLDVYVTQQLRSTGLSRAETQRLIAERLITVNGCEAKPSIRLKPDDRIEVRSLPAREISLAAEDLPLDTLYEDSHLIVVNKPAGMMVHPAGRTTRGTLVNALLYHCPDLPGIGGEKRPGIVHRLDKDTSGVMVVAKTGLAFQRLARQFKEREVEKEYVALVWGKLPADAGVIDVAIGRHRSDRKRMSGRYAQAKRREAWTEWKVQAVYKLEAGDLSPGRITLLRLKPRTGRTHQLRVHLADLGFPIVGDKIYGHKRKERAKSGCAVERALQEFPRQALHAECLGFVHPITQKRVTFHAPLPGDMKELIEDLAQRAGG
jgi:23S rRNA pseudouridine1911/1915/1917 synthase